MSKSLKYFLIAACSLVFVTLVFIIYRMFFQFDSQDIRTYAAEEASKYGAQKATAYALILEGVNDILRSHARTAQVLRSARATNTDPEQELVHAAIAQCKAYNYLEA